MDDLDEFILYNAIEDDSEENDHEEEEPEEEGEEPNLSFGGSDSVGKGRVSKWDGIRSVLGYDGCAGCLLSWIQVLLFTLFLFWLVQACT